MKQKPKLIIFDFDGTIADTLDAAISIFNRFARRYRYDRITHEERLVLRTKTSREIFRSLNVSFFTLPFVARRVKRELNATIEDISLIPGIKEALVTLAKEDIRLGILTSNSRANAEAFVAYHKLPPFTFIATGGFFRKDRMLQRVIREQRLKPKDVIYVGDETRDIDAARKAGIRCIAVTWGVNEREILESQSPDFLITHPSELPKLFRN